MLRIDQSVWAGKHTAIIAILMQLTDSDLEKVEKYARDLKKTRRPELSPKYIKAKPESEPPSGAYVPDSLMQRNSPPSGSIGAGRLGKLHGRR